MALAMAAPLDSYARVATSSADSEQLGRSSTGSGSNSSGFEVREARVHSAKETALLHRARWSSAAKAASLLVAAAFAVAALSVADSSGRSAATSSLRHGATQVKDQLYAPVTSSPSSGAASPWLDAEEMPGAELSDTGADTSASVASTETPATAKGYYDEPIRAGLSDAADGMESSSISTSISTSIDSSSISTSIDSSSLRVSSDAGSISVGAEFGSSNRFSSNLGSSISSSISSSSSSSSSSTGSRSDWSGGGSSSSSSGETSTSGGIADASNSSSGSGSGSDSGSSSSSSSSRGVDERGISSNGSVAGRSSSSLSDSSDSSGDLASSGDAYSVPTATSDYGDIEVHDDYTSSEVDSDYSADDVDADYGSHEVDNSGLQTAELPEEPADESVEEKAEEAYFDRLVSTTYTVTNTYYYGSDTPQGSYSTPTATSTVVPNSLFCFALMMPHGYEKGLIMHLLMKGQSIFACDAYSVFSETRIQISPGPPVPIYTGAMGSMKCGYGGPFHLALNTDVFVKAWRKVFEERKFLKYGWTVKVDPDCVFLPKLLRQQLRHSHPEGNVYLNNCDQGLHGPIEVISVGGMRHFRDGIDDCLADEKLKEERNTGGEDVFLRHCLGFLQINRVDNFHLLSEEACFWEDPVHKGCVSGKVAFHPFKDVDSYFRCLNQAKDTSTTTTTLALEQ